MKHPVLLAAQADLVLLTVEMLQPPAGAMDVLPLPWFELAPEQLDQLLDSALGSASRQVMAELENESVDLSPRSALFEVLRCAREISTQEWTSEYSRLFYGATLCPLNQASFVRRDKGNILGSVSGFYHAFGWRTGLKSGERPDHLLCQLEFIAMLLALASRAPDMPTYEVVMDALSKFAREHMHDWLPAMCWQMCEESRLDYFAAVSQWILVLWQTLTDLHQWPIDERRDVQLEPVREQDDPYECGAPDLHQIQMHQG